MDETKQNEQAKEPETEKREQDTEAEVCPVQKALNDRYGTQK